MKLTITADAYSLTSEISVADIELLSKYNPDALRIKDKDGNEKFAISYVEGKPCTSDFGITFGGRTRDEAGKATVTDIIPSSIKDAAAAKNFVAEKFGSTVAYLKQLETSVPREAKKIADERKALVESITLA